MKIGTFDGAQSLGWRKNKNERVDEPNAKPHPTRAMIPPSFENSPNAPAALSATDATVPGVPVVETSETPRAASVRATGGAPGSAPVGNGVPGANSNAGRTVQWKGKTLNLAARAAEPLSETETPSDAAAAQSQQVLSANLATLLAGMDEMCGGLQEIYSVLHKVSERDTAGEKVFNTLHAELSDYKKDFIYEHLKPVVRPLLFLYDSLEQFEGEIERFDPIETQPASVDKSGAMPTRLVRQNTIYFREQLVEALRICEVTPMDDPEGVFNARFHKAVKVVPVEVAEDGKVQRVVRSGWFLNGQLLRSAEVVLGKKK